MVIANDCQPTQRVDNTGTATFVYDKLNRMTQKVAGDGTTFDYTYDGVGNLKTLKDPSSATPTSYDYTNVNLVSKITEPNAAQTTFTYDKSGNRISTVYPNGVKQYVAYEASSRICNVVGTTTTLGSPLTCTQTVSGAITRFAYDYKDTSGSDSLMRRKLTDKDDNVTTYSYDVINRLTEAQTKNSGGTVTDTRAYLYDGTGNLTRQTINGSATSYRYNDDNRLCWSVSGTSSNACGSPPTGATTYTYDDNGNLTGTSAGLSATYNEKNQNTSITPPGGTARAMSYADAPQDERVSFGGRTFAYSLLGLGVDRPSSGTHVYYTRDDGGMLVSKREGTASSYYLTDGLGSVVALTGSGGTVLNTYKYDPYGRNLATTGTAYNPWQFAQGFLDSATGLTKFGTRYYDRTTTRWTQTDPQRGGLSNPLSLNPYAYVAGNPVNGTDTRGRTHDAFSVSLTQTCQQAAGGVRTGCTITNVAYHAIFFWTSTAPSQGTYDPEGGEFNPSSQDYGFYCSPPFYYGSGCVSTSP